MSRRYELFNDDGAYVGTATLQDDTDIPNGSKVHARNRKFKTDALAFATDHRELDSAQEQARDHKYQVVRGGVPYYNELEIINAPVVILDEGAAKRATSMVKDPTGVLFVYEFYTSIETDSEASFVRVHNLGTGEDEHLVKYETTRAGHDAWVQAVTIATGHLDVCWAWFAGHGIVLVKGRRADKLNPFTKGNTLHQVDGTKRGATEALLTWAEDNGVWIENYDPDTNRFNI